MEYVRSFGHLCLLCNHVLPRKFARFAAMLIAVCADLLCLLFTLQFLTLYVN